MSGPKLLTPEQAEEYRPAVANYHPSGQVVVDFARSKFGVIAGPTGAGKDTIRNELIKDPEFVKILSTTSRPARQGEVDGEVYHFRNLDFFDQGIDERRFLQIALVHNQQLACLDFNDISNLRSGQMGLAILVVQTEIELRHLNPDLKTIFVVPPSLDELIRRIKSSRSMAPDEVDRRLKATKIELEIALKQPNYYCLVNDDINLTIKLSKDFMVNSERDSSADAKAKIVIQELLNALSNYNI